MAKHGRVVTKQVFFLFRGKRNWKKYIYNFVKLFYQNFAKFCEIVFQFREISAYNQFREICLIIYQFWETSLYNYFKKFVISRFTLTLQSPVLHLDLPGLVWTTGACAAPGTVYNTAAWNAPGRAWTTGAYAAPGHVYTSEAYAAHKHV